MKFKENDVVRIIKEHGSDINCGDIGTVLMVFEKPQEAYEIEILDETGIPKVQCAMPPDSLELVEDLGGNYDNVLL